MRTILKIQIWALNTFAPYFISKAKLNQNILTVTFIGGACQQYLVNTETKQFRMLPFMHKPTTSMNEKLDRILAYIERYGNDYPTEHIVLEKLSKTAKTIIVLISTIALLSSCAKSSLPCSKKYPYRAIKKPVISTAQYFPLKPRTDVFGNKVYRAWELNNSTK